MQRFSILTLLVVLLMVVGGVFAQDDATQFCGDLSDADCELLQSIDIADSAFFAGEGLLEVAVTDGETYSVPLEMSGSYITDPELISMYRDLYSSTPQAVLEEMYASPDAFVEFITGFFQVVNSDLTMSVSVPESISGGMHPDPIALNLWLVDGVAYADVGAFSFADPSLEGVYGIDMVALYTDLFNDPMMSDMFDDVISAQGEVQIQNFADMEFVSDFTTLRRLDDVTIDGQTMAVFETVIDYGALFNSEQMRDVFEAQFEAQAEAMAEMGEGEDVEEMQDTMMAVMDAYAILFEGTLLTSQQAVGLDDMYVHSTDVSFVMDVDGEAAFAAFNEGANLGEEEMPPMGIPSFSVDFSMNVTQDGFGSIESIGLPDNAEILPMDMLAGM